MRINKTKYILSLFIACFSTLSYGYTDSIDLNENMSMHVGMTDYYQKGIYHIQYPGSDAWLENGSYHVTEKMPACLIVLSDSLDATQLEKFINGLEITTSDNRKLPFEQYKGTWTFVDKDPWNSSFADSTYTIKPKNNLTFGQLLQYVGGTQSSMVTIEFSRGCIALATRPFLPEKMNVTVKKNFERS